VITEDFCLFCRGETRRKEKEKKRGKKISRSPSHTDTPMRNNSEPLPADCDGIWHLSLLDQISSAGNQRLGGIKNINQRKKGRKKTKRHTHAQQG